MKNIPSPAIKNTKKDEGASKIVALDAGKVIKSYKDIGLDVKNLITTEVDIYKCKATGYRFYYPFTLAGNREFYEYLAFSRPYYNPSRWEHVRSLEILERECVSGSIFEFGCGPGHFLSRTRFKKKYGLDFNPSVTEDLKLKNDIEIVSSASLNDAFLPESMDAICMFQVLEHITEVGELLATLVSLIKPGGMMIVGVPNNNPYLYKHETYHALNLPPHHMGLWDARSLVNVMRMHGLNTDKIIYEPLKDFEHWMSINLQHYTGNRIGNMLLKNIYGRRRVVFNRIIAGCKGRNVLGVFRKPLLA